MVRRMPGVGGKKQRLHPPCFIALVYNQLFSSGFHPALLPGLEEKSKKNSGRQCNLSFNERVYELKVVNR
jgi:hypothetical protein